MIRAAIAGLAVIASLTAAVAWETAMTAANLAAIQEQAQ